MQNNKRTDISDIKDIIEQLDKEKQKITSKSIAEKLGQTAANVHRILSMFNIDLKQYRDNHKTENNIKKNLKISETISKLKKLNTSELTLEELIEKTNFTDGIKSFKRLMNKENFPYVKLWYIQLLKGVKTEEKTLKELYDYCNFQKDEISLATFRTRLFENKIKYKKDYSRKS